jgi:hypothetical protein
VRHLDITVHSVIVDINTALLLLVQLVQPTILLVGLTKKEPHS